MNIECDAQTEVTFWGTHREIRWQVSGHGFGEPGAHSFSAYWCTYVLLTEEMHEKLKGRIVGAPWNGDQTYYRKIVNEHVDGSEELRAGGRRPVYKIGDDFSHSWDADSHRGRLSRERLERHIQQVIDYLLDDSAPEEPA